jgi:hypothetical protein
LHERIINKIFYLFVIKSIFLSIFNLIDSVLRHWIICLTIIQWIRTIFFLFYFFHLVEFFHVWLIVHLLFNLVWMFIKILIFLVR